MKLKKTILHQNAKKKLKKTYKASLAETHKYSRKLKGICRQLQCIKQLDTSPANKYLGTKIQSWPVTFQAASIG